MKTQSFKLFELLNLEAELAGATNNQTGEKIIEGLLNQKLPVVTKYHLNILLSNLSAEKKTIDALRDELIKKYGVEDKETGKIIISLYLPGTEEFDDDNNIINGTPNPIYIEFQKEYSDLINDDLEIKYKPIPLSVLSRIETESVYPFILQNLITTE